MELQRQIAKVWETYQDNEYLPSFIIDRKFGFYVDIEQKDILVLGLAPFFHSKSVLKPTKYNMFYHIGDESRMNSYQREINKLLFDRVLGIDLLTDTTYFDLFFFRDQFQDSSIDQLLDILDGRMFLIDQLEISQRILEEVVKPKVIVLNSYDVALFMGFYGQDADSSWLGYKFQEIESTSSGHFVYKITGIVEDPVCGKEYIGNTNLMGTYVICYPTLLTGELETDECALVPHEINYYKEISLLQGPLKPSKKNNKGVIDVDLLLKYPSLYTYLLESRSDAIALLGKSLLIDLKQYKKVSARKMAYAIFTKFVQEKVILLDDIINLCNTEFCIKTFNTKTAVLLHEKTDQIDKNKYFEEPFELIDNQRFYLLNGWRPNHKEALEKWFVDLMYYSKLNNYE